jgi:hypothetical protein
MTIPLREIRLGSDGMPLLQHLRDVAFWDSTRLGDCVAARSSLTKSEVFRTPSFQSSQHLDKKAAQGSAGNYSSFRGDGGVPQL